MSESQALVFRPMAVEDIEQVVAIEKMSFHTPWTGEAFARELRENRLARYFVVESQGLVAGYCGLWIIVDEAHVTNIAVSKNFRRQGIAHFLMKRVVETLIPEGVERMTLEVRVGNVEALGLYEKMGFESAGIRPNYYTDTNEDAEIMWKNLNEGTL